MNPAPGSPSRGAPLEDRARWESLLGGHDFSSVRVHADERAADAAHSLGAAAFTVGENIVFGSRRYAPNWRDGRRLIAHELAHVVQQRRGGPAPARPDSASERAAEAVALTVAAGRSVADVGGATAVGIARQTIDPRHARGFAGEQGMGFEHYSAQEGWILVEGPSGAAGHGVTTSGFDGVAYNPTLDELHLADNKSLAAAGDVRSATAIDPSRNLLQNLDGLIARVQTARDTPWRIRILQLLRQARTAVAAKQPLPSKVRLVVTGVGGRSTGVSARLAQQGVEFRPSPTPKPSASATAATPPAATTAKIAQPTQPPTAATTAPSTQAPLPAPPEAAVPTVPPTSAEPSPTTTAVPKTTTSPGAISAEPPVAPSVIPPSATPPVETPSVPTPVAAKPPIVTPVPEGAPPVMTPRPSLGAGLKAGAEAAAFALLFIGLEYLVQRAIRQEIEDGVAKAKRSFQRRALDLKAEHPDFPVYLTIEARVDDYFRYFPLLGWVPDKREGSVWRAELSRTRTDPPIVAVEDHSLDVFRPGKTTTVTYSELLVP